MGKFSQISSGGFGSGGIGGGGNKRGAGFITIIIMLFLVIFFTINPTSGKREKESEQKTTDSSETVIKKPIATTESKKEETKEEKTESTTAESTTESTNEFVKEKTKSDSEKEKDVMNNSVLTGEMIPEYDGKNKVIAVNAGFADFEIDDFFGDRSFRDGWVYFGEQDSSNRLSSAKAFITKDSLSENKNKDSSINPTGWNSAEINNKEVFNRSYLIDSSFSKDSLDVAENIFTGTVNLNTSDQSGMVHYENLVRDSVSKGYSVMLEVIPIYIEDNLVPIGIQMRAISYGNDYLDFNVFIYNVENGVTINYATGSVK